MWMVAMCLAQSPPDPPTLTLDGNRILLDGERVMLPGVRPLLLADPGSRPAAQKAKRTGALGVGLAILGGSVMVLGGAAAFASDDPTPGRVTTIAGSGVLIGGAVVRLRSFRLWKKSIPDYQGR